MQLHYNYRTATMKLSDFRKAQSDARLFVQENDAQGIGFDAIVTMCYVTNALGHLQSSSDNHASTTSPLPSPTGAAPDWFMSALLEFEGKKVNASTILRAANRPAGIAETREAGVWLRAMMGDPIRSNGQILYRIILAKRPPAHAGSQETSPMEEDLEDPYGGNRPIESKVASFCADNQGEFNPQQVCLAIGIAANHENQRRVWAALQRDGKPSGKPGHVTLGLR